MKICELKQAVRKATDRRTFSIIGYSLLSMYLFESMNERNKRMFALAGSIFGLEVLLNYIELEELASVAGPHSVLKEHPDYHHSMYSNDGYYYQPQYY